jgi:hypothetical protein
MQVIDLTTLPWSHVTRSPDEEWRARAAQSGAPEPIGDDFAAALLTEARVVTITAQGIRFRLNNREHHFWQEDSLTLVPGHVGQQRTIRYDADDLSCVHVFERTGDSIRYVETLARYIAPHMLNADECGQVLAASQRQSRRVLAELQELHRPEIEAEAQRVLTNAEKLQHVRTFPLPDGQRPAIASRHSQAKAEADATADTFSADQNSQHVSGDEAARPSTRATGQPLGGDSPRAFSDSAAESSRRSFSEGGSPSPTASSPDAPAPRQTVPPESYWPDLRTAASAPDRANSEAARITPTGSLTDRLGSLSDPRCGSSRRSPAGEGGLSAQLVAAGRGAKRHLVNTETEADARRARSRDRMARLAAQLGDY